MTKAATKWSMRSGRAHAPARSATGASLCPMSARWCESGPVNAATARCKRRGRTRDGM